MRILYLTNGFPYPLTSGYLRHYYLIRELSKRHSVTLFSLTRKTPAEEHLAAMAPLVERVETFAFEEDFRPRLGRRLSRFRFLPGVNAALGSMCRAVEQAVQSHSFNTVLMSGKETLPLLDHVGDLPVVADVCDAASVRVRGRMKHSRWVKSAWLASGYLYLRFVERQLARRCGHLVFASARDRNALLPPSHERATVIPNGVDVDFWSRESPRLGSNTIAFTGAMCYPPNVDAALYLANEIFPHVRQSIPNARLFIVGRDPTGELIDAGRQPGITVTGFVDDVRPYLDEASVFVAPLRFGAGIQNKVLEAMAMKVPVITSPLAADGLRTNDDTVPPLCIAESRGELVAQILRSLHATAHNPEPHHQGRRFVEEHFVWERCAEQLEEVFEEVILQIALERTA